MRRTLGALLCLLLLLGPAAAEEKPRQRAKPLTPEQAADAVLEAVRAKTEKVLGRLAKEDNPDPWMVVEELCDRGEHDGAEAFARAAPRKAVEKLPAYIGSRRGKAPDGTARDTLAVMLDATARGEWPRVFDAADVAPKRLDTVVGLRIAFGRGMALRFLSRLSESTKAPELAALVAE